jgi:hypothetical protein
VVPCAGPQLVDQVHRISLYKINPELENPHHFAMNPLGFFVINPQSTKNPRRPLVFKIFSKIPLATFQKLQKIPATSFHHIFATVTLISVILAPKFSESLPLSSYAFINTCLWHFID